MANAHDGIAYVEQDLASAGLGELEVLVTVVDLVGHRIVTKTTHLGLGDVRNFCSPNYIELLEIY